MKDSLNGKIQPIKPTDSWYSRGYLPHCEDSGKMQSITIRPGDAMPRHVVEKWKLELGINEETKQSEPQSIELRRRIAKYEDRGNGACWLKKFEVATIVQDALIHFHGSRYQLLAWCIMPNHVHVMIRTFSGFPLNKVTHAWKSFTANKINNLLKRSGELWARESHDRFIRNEIHFNNVLNYIENNPVSAGLAQRETDWTFSSPGQGWSITDE